MQSSRSLPARAGVQWFMSAVTATRKQPLLLVGIVMFYMLSMSMLTAVPWFGPVLAALFMPYGTVFLGHATRDALDDKVPSFAELGRLIRDNRIRQSMIRIGLVFGGLLLVVNSLYGWLAADEIARWTITSNNRLDWTSVRANFPWDATIAMLVIYIPGLMAVWFAPMLAADKGMDCGKAIFFSFFGCLKNILPVIVLGVVLCATSAVVISTAMGLVMALELTDDALLVMTPIVFLVSTVIYASYWPMYAKLFEDEA